MRIPKETILIIAVLITGIIIGGWLMYLIDSTWVYDKVERKKELVENRTARYSEALEVSHQMVNNCYDAFYTISKCSTKAGCEFMKTALTLHDLNKEREELKAKSEVLNEEIKSLIGAQKSRK